MNDYLVAKLREGRLSKGLKQSDVTKLIGIKNTTLSNYENGITEPDIDTFLQLCELYDLDYVTILGEAYGLSVSGADFDIKPSEIEIIKKYRSLDSFGQETVNYMIDRESDRSEQIAGLEEQIGRTGSRAYSDAELRAMSVEDKVDLYRQELEREEKVRAESAAS